MPGVSDKETEIFKSM